jgi:FKBP12-rapamycin complex-associated protein
VKTCCSLSFTQNNERIGTIMEKLVNKLLEKFFIVATTDNDYRIRSTMLKYLNPQFDPFVAKYNNILALFNCMNDHSLDIRERTIKILSRLMKHNPSIILPYLRNLLIELLSTLEYSVDFKEKEENTKLLKTFIKSCKDLVKSYTKSILQALISKLESDQTTSSFMSAILEAIGELSNVGGNDIKPYLGDLIPLIMECIKDQSSTTKREISIKALILIIENTGNSEFVSLF